LLRNSSIPVLAVFQSRDFRFLWTSRSIHEVSRRMELLVLGYLILRLTDSAFQVGLIAVFLNAPRPVLGLFAGLLADRLDRRRILIGAHTIYFGIAIAILLLLVTGAIQPWHVFIAVFVRDRRRWRTILPGGPPYLIWRVKNVLPTQCPWKPLRTIGARY